MKRSGRDWIIAYVLLVPVGIAGVFAGTLFRFMCDINDVSYFEARKILRAKEYNHERVKWYLQHYPNGYACISIRKMLDQYARKQIAEINESTSIDELLKLKADIAGSAFENLVADVVTNRFGAFGEAVLVNTTEAYRAYIARGDVDMREEALTRWERYEIANNAAGNRGSFSSEIKDRILESGRSLLTVLNSTDMRITLKLRKGTSTLQALEATKCAYEFGLAPETTCVFVLEKGEYVGMAIGKKTTKDGRRVIVSRGLGSIRTDLRNGEDKIDLKCVRL